MLPANWKPVATRDLELIGPEGDGSYVVARQSLADVDLLVSMGLNDDWNFEAEFARRTGARIVCYDASVTSRFWLRRAISWGLRLQLAKLTTYSRYKKFFAHPKHEHRKLFVGHDRPGFVSLDTILAEFPNEKAFLKADIEGGEYRILDQIVKHQSRLTGIAMEFHDIDLHRERIDAFINGLTEFSVIALHPNNFGGTDAEGDPMVIEIALARKEFLQPDADASAPFQRQNNLNAPPIVIAYG